MKKLLWVLALLLLPSYAFAQAGIGPTTNVANEGVTGTVVNKLVKYTGAPTTAIVLTTSDTTGIQGIVTGNAGTGTPNPIIAKSGLVLCVFDGATTAGHYVQASGSAAGDCHDTGAATEPTSGDTVGRVLSTNGGGGTYLIDMQLSPSPAAGSGTVTSVTCGTGLSGGTITTSGTCTLDTTHKNSWTGSQRGTPVNIAISTSTFTPNFDTAQNFEIDLTSACPCTLANPSTSLVAGQSGVIEIHQDGTGSRTIGTYGSDYQYVGGTSAITLSTGASKIDYLSYYVNNAATGIVLGTLLTAPSH